MKTMPRVRWYLSVPVFFHGHDFARHQFGRRVPGLLPKALPGFWGVDPFQPYGDRLPVDEHFERVAIGDADHLAAEFFDDLGRAAKTNPANSKTPVAAAHRIMVSSR